MRASRLNGRRGGLATAKKYSLEQRVEWGERAGQATLNRYSSEYYSHIRKMRKTYGPHKKTRSKRVASGVQELSNKLERIRQRQ